MPAGSRHPAYARLTLQISRPGHPQTQRIIESKVDSGADMTIIPRNLAVELGLVQIDDAVLVSFDGAKTFAESSPCCQRATVAGFEF
jgi:hypothetical protein